MLLLVLSTAFFRFKRTDSFTDFRDNSPGLSIRFWVFFAGLFLLLGLGAELRILKTDTGLPLPLGFGETFAFGFLPGRALEPRAAPASSSGYKYTPYRRYNFY